MGHRTPLRPLQSIPPIVDTAIEPSSDDAVEVSELCERAGIRYRVSGGWPPLIVLRKGGGNVRGRLKDARESFVVDVSALPTEEPEHSMRILEVLVRGFDCYPAHVRLCDGGYFSPASWRRATVARSSNRPTNEAPLPRNALVVSTG